MWKNMLNPSINKQKWSKDEDAKLVELILQSKEFKDWDLIAAELDNDRTPFQCFHRYYINFLQLCKRVIQIPFPQGRINHKAD